MTDMDTVQRMIGEWAEATFPRQTNESIVAHLQEEVGELRLDVLRRDPLLVGEELADCAILLLTLAHRHGVSLADEIVAKQSINAQRTWFTDDDGMTHHARRRRRS